MGTMGARMFLSVPQYLQELQIHFQVEMAAVHFIKMQVLNLYNFFFVIFSVKMPTDNRPLFFTKSTKHFRVFLQL